METSKKEMIWNFFFHLFLQCHNQQTSSLLLSLSSSSRYHENVCLLFFHTFCSMFWIVLSRWRENFRNFSNVTTTNERENRWKIVILRNDEIWSTFLRHGMQDKNKTHNNNENVFRIDTSRRVLNVINVMMTK